MMRELDALYRAHACDGVVVMTYDVEILFGTLR
jgi:hypothetical protein